MEAARIATGATKLVFVPKLYDKTGWETLEIRRRKHRLVLFYKMYNNISPLYLSSLAPPLAQNTSNYSLRNADDIRTIQSRTSLYSNSFLSSTFRDWNNLPSADRNADSVDSLKWHLSHGRISVPKYFYAGNSVDVADFAHKASNWLHFSQIRSLLEKHH